MSKILLIVNYRSPDWMIHCHDKVAHTFNDAINELSKKEYNYVILQSLNDATIKDVVDWLVLHREFIPETFKIYVDPITEVQYRILLYSKEKNA